ncbi:MAG: hypothetical protein H7647_04790, partial [Candidatus Heimdallarchaeota archaeon]|nr:hypothetical protein [Candidatus Heimdallarchaeota archaeon]MCK4253741.1 hypothetical protein [Candidatus Heimdallarchaeota archaeon]
MSYMKIYELQEHINHLKSSAELEALISHLKILASNNRSDKIVIKLIEDCILIATKIEDFKSRVILDGLLILQFVQQADKLEKSIQLLHEMQTLAKKINYKEGLAFSHSFAWYIAKLKGKKERGKYEIVKALELLEEVDQPDRFIFHFIKYTYAVEQWLETRDFKSSVILEECGNFFYLNGYSQSFAKTLCILIVIYQQTQNKEKSLALVKDILSNYNLLLNMPEEIQSVVHYFIGVGHKLSFNLGETEKHLLETERILKPIYKDSIYSRYYLTALSHLSATYALQGKLELALNQMKGVEELLEEEIALKNLDSFSKNQIIHTFNLAKFYLQSRLHDLSIEKFQDLIQTIISNIGTYHSNAIMLSELLLNANLTKTELQDIKNLDNPSTRRVEHILDFLICQGSDDKQALQRINTLKRRPV